MDGYTPFRNVEAKNLVQEYVEVPTVLRSLHVPAGGRMLEVGCGRGIALGPLMRRCAPERLVGIDIDERLLSLAASRASDLGVELVRADVRQLPFADEEFDVVVDFGTLYHIDHSGQALREISRVLVPHGLLIHETPIAQLAAHPIRAFRHTVPWTVAPELSPARKAVFWASRMKVDS